MKRRFEGRQPIALNAITTLTAVHAWSDPIIHSGDIASPAAIAPPDILRAEAEGWDGFVALADAVPPALVERPDVDIVVELFGGYEPARRLILKALAAGKDVVTANKALLAGHGEQIFRAAARAGLAIGFEASVGGGVPVITRTCTGGGWVRRNISSDT